MRSPGTVRTPTPAVGRGRAIALHVMTQETRYVASGNHVMKPFVEVEDGEVMRGKAFPRIYPI